MTLENAFVMNTSNIKYGPGATREIGYDMQRAGSKAGDGGRRPAPGA